MDRMGDAARKATRELEQNFREEVQRLRITWKEGEKDEEEVVSELRRKVIRVLNGAEAQNMEKEFEKTMVEVDKLEKDIKATEGVMLHTDRGKEAVMKIVNELQAELDAAKKKAESLKDARQSQEAYQALKPIAEAIKTSREEKGNHMEESESLLEGVRKTWYELRQELWDEVVNSKKTLLVWDRRCVKHPGNSWERPQRLEEAEEAFQSLESDVYEKRGKIKEDQYFPMYMDEDHPGGPYTEEVGARKGEWGSLLITPKLCEGLLMAVVLLIMVFCCHPFCLSRFFGCIPKSTWISSA